MNLLELAAVGAIVTLIAVPHLLPLHRVSGALASVIWFCSLALRALVAMACALFVFVWLPQTGFYATAAEWCWHEVLPIVTAHVGISGHPLIHLAVLVPALTLAASLTWVVFGFGRAWVSVRGLLRRAMGEGPHGSAIIDSDDVMVAVTRLGRTRIVISKAALLHLDDAELDASVRHEEGHIERRHRPALMAAAALAGIARLVPGTRRAEAQFRFSIERDADEYAVRRTRDPLALASAICSVAKGRSAEIVGAGLGLHGDGTSVIRRVARLDGTVPPAGDWMRRLSTVVAVAGVGAAIVLAVALPAWAVTAPRDPHALAEVLAHCPD